MKFSIFNFYDLRFEIIWLSHKKDILNFVGMALILNVSSKNIIKHFK